MNDRKFAKAQIARMLSLDFAPQTKPGLQEIEDALMQFPSTQMCGDWVNEWIRTREDFPKPVHIWVHHRQRDEMLQIEKDAWKKEPQCAQCGDSGWCEITKGKHTGVRRCDCKTRGVLA